MSFLDIIKKLFNRNNQSLLNETEINDSIELELYNSNDVDFSIKIHKRNIEPHHIKIETGVEKNTKEYATEADKLIKWMQTGEKIGLQKYTDNQLAEIKNSVLKFQQDMKRDGIDLENKMQVLAYIYCKLQTTVLYKSPLVLTGEWGNQVENNDIYGGLVERYSPCAGISWAAELLGKYNKINVRSIDISNAGVQHSINGIILPSNKILLFDVADAIGMTADGKYKKENGRIIPRDKQLYVKDIKANQFGLTHKPKYNASFYNEFNVLILQEDKKVELLNDVMKKINSHRIGSLKIDSVKSGSIHIEKGINPIDNKRIKIRRNDEHMER